ncbi:transcriptional regulator, GntR family [Primorskyibacter flagellatus]|uniref:Transcriptional regulator, GntR family n=2 Tax=Primorskyibacter flagellatus TaxID=1387277 RepID=A0A1W2AN92_9RHOB|nr:transcriptional regulator, GntR family [Primorskyibacter flagellatus]
MTEASERFARMHAALRDRICLLDYTPGTRLSEAELATEFKTSRTPVRRVLARLEDEGLVQTRHGIGTIVTDANIRTMAQTYELRMELAQLAGQLSPRPVRPADLQRLDALCRQTEALVIRPDPRAFAVLNMHLHQFLTSLTSNAALCQVSDRLYYQTARIWLLAIPDLDLLSEVQIFAAEIWQIHTALSTGDLRAVGLLRRAHISMSFKRLGGF